MVSSRSFFVPEMQTGSWSRILSTEGGSALSYVSHNLHTSIIKMEA